MVRSTFLGMLGLALAIPSLAQHRPHSHGVAELQLVVDGGTLQIELETPLDNLVGFEHAPTNARQREALAATEARLARAEGLFVLPVAAGCALEAAEVQSPFPQHADGDHGGAHENGVTHSELHAAYTYACARPDALKEVEVKLFDAFPRLRSIRAEFATPGGQGAATLDKARRKLSL